MQYTESFEIWLNNFINFEKNPQKKGFSLETMQKYVAYLKNPQYACRSVHIAGSKGKGSTAAMVASLLTEQGHKTGLFISPHVINIKERITQNGIFFRDAAYNEVYHCIRKKIEELQVKDSNTDLPTWFELLTLAAFLMFKNEGMTWAVYETGMGGRLDATNCVRPDITILTPIELEHCNYLGTTISQIASEKAGIIKNGIPVFCAPQQYDARCIFECIAQECDAPFFYVYDAVKDIKTSITVSGIEIYVCFYARHRIGGLFSRSLHTVLPLFTPVQVYNAITAACAFKYYYPCASEELIERALSRAWLPARFQLLCKNPFIVLDGAHTKTSIQSCVHTFFSLVHRKALLVFACASDKNPVELAPLFLGKFSHIYLTLPGIFKTGNLPQIEQAFSNAFSTVVQDHTSCKIREFNSINTAIEDDTVFICSNANYISILQNAFMKSKQEHIPLLITGSFYLAAEAQRIYSDVYAVD